MPASQDEQAFLDRIAATPADYAPHGVYADWLDENDRPEEADWHRAWSAEKAAAARKWFDKFAEENSGVWEDSKEYTGQEIIDIALNYQVTGHRHTQHNSQDLQDAMYDRETRKTFWHNLGLATGVYPGKPRDNPFDAEMDSPDEDDYYDYENPFSCSC